MNALLLVLCCCQDPSPQPPPALDVVVLKNGDRLEGRITAQLDGYVELRLEAGATIGLGLAQVAEVLRGGGAPDQSSAASVAPSDQWFTLHDGSGQAVGFLHALVTNGADGAFTVSEEYEFADGRARWQITSMCTADASWLPKSCYFRERRSDPTLAAGAIGAADRGAQAERIVDERIVEATVDGERLKVSHLDRGGRRERELEFARGATFPLLARALARRSGSSFENLRLFDPATEEVVVRTFDGARQRHVTIDGKPVQVTEIAETTANGRNAEWIDATSRTLRREIAGPALVAVPSSRDSVTRAARGAAIPSAIAAEAGGAFGLWVPNPAWHAEDGMPAGQVALRCDAHGATICLSRLDHLERGAALDTAAESVANWFRLLYPDVAIERREPAVVRDRAAIRLVGRSRGGSDPVRAVVEVIPYHDDYLVLVCRARAAAWDELEPDFAFVRRTVELESQSLAPKLQGPVAERAPAKAGKTAPPPRVAPPPARPAGEGPIVRIPNDG